MTTQVPAEFAMMFGHANDNSVRRIGPSDNALRGCRSACFGVARSTELSARLYSDISSPNPIRREELSCHRGRSKGVCSTTQQSATRELAHGALTRTQTRVMQLSQISRCSEACLMP